MSELEGERSYSGLERTMFFITPILFTLVLLGALLLIFNTGLREKVLDIGSGIPVIGGLFPAPPAEENEVDDNALRSTNLTAKIEELEAALAGKESELSALQSTGQEQEQTIAELQSELEQLTLTSEEAQLSEDEYEAHIKSLASMYTQITPSRAAPILESMELEEIALLFGAMRPEDRVRIMERMNPETAAAVTLKMKDMTPVANQQLAALQARIDKLEASPAPSSSAMDETELSATFSSMNPESAGKLLLEMAKLSQAKVLRILNAVNSGARSQILAAMSEADEALTAQLASKLTPGA
ncbi:MgtE protein [Paenibacillus sp. IB182496]|uniref:MgtE protein n=1 Tax=Paenibacillus sabuli TaxID=2772509 RepID=A0A927BSV2_9BACL|nr:MgtE protein [Paenibacillus sabuli]MBD2845286.1 MgtE protein [Paenibacillus sabuli]